MRLVTGQSINDWQKRGAALAAAWRAERLTIRATTPASCASSSTEATCWPNPLPYPCRPGNHSQSGRGAGRNHRDADLVAAPRVGQHILIAGATGAGKGSVLWSLIAGLAPHVKTGRVRLCVIDPKGGMELGAGARCSPSSATTPATPPSNCCASWWQ
ncbi:ftsK/SpoIIIE family protein [Mycobacterium xenopi 4042]|uniref:FtsK/SpoIIIE family protein n=1 Tax=Mycobacterium xenopi 4042 TaxID=1299334 RepID=X8CJ29_MYCXE|nr:ftsK/SpoIIIE family protein [Mycobacterium xenopi 4042]